MTYHESMEKSFRNKVEYYADRLQKMVGDGDIATDLFTTRERRSLLYNGVLIPNTKRVGDKGLIAHGLSPKAKKILQELSKMNTNKPNRASRTSPKGLNVPEKRTIMKEGNK